MTSPPTLAHPVLRAADVHRVNYSDTDRELFNRFLRDFVPPIFSIDAPYYALTLVGPAAMVIDMLMHPKKDEKKPAAPASAQGPKLAATA